MDKKSYFVVIALLLFNFCSIYAQTNKGRFIVGEFTELRFDGSALNPMNFGYSNIKTKSDSGESDSDKNATINLMPKAGYFVIDNLAIGLDLSGTFSMTKSSSGSSKQTITILSMGPFIRYYIPVSKVLPFFELNGLIGAYKSKYERDKLEDSVHNYNLASWGGGIGMAVPLSDRVTFDMIARYNSYNSKKKEDNEDNTIYIVGTMGLKLGFTIILGSSQ